MLNFAISIYGHIYTYGHIDDVAYDPACHVSTMRSGVIVQDDDVSEFGIPTK